MSTSNMVPNDIHAGMTLISQMKTYKLHKAIVCPQSRPISTALQLGHPRQQPSTFILKGHDPEAVDAVVDFLYKGTVDFSGARKSKLLHAVNVYLLASTLGIKRLVILAGKRITKALPHAWQSHDFLRAATLIYEEVLDDALHNLLTRTIAQHVDNFLHKDEFVALYQDNMALATDILDAMGRRPLSTRYQHLQPVGFDEEVRLGSLHPSEF